MGRKNDARFGDASHLTPHLGMLGFKLALILALITDDRAQ